MNKHEIAKQIAKARANKEYEAVRVWRSLLKMPPVKIILARKSDDKHDQ